MNEIPYCDRQGCLRWGDTFEKLPDGCIVRVCKEHKPFFHLNMDLTTHDSTAPGVYWHRHNNIDLF